MRSLDLAPAQPTLTASGAFDADAPPPLSFSPSSAGKAFLDFLTLPLYLPARESFTEPPPLALQVPLPDAIVSVFFVLIFSFLAVPFVTASAREAAESCEHVTLTFRPFRSALRDSFAPRLTPRLPLMPTTVVPPPFTVEPAPPPPAAVTGT